MLAFLDAIEPDPDLEEDDEGGGDVQDEPHDGDFDHEPSLGAIEQHCNAYGSGDYNGSGSQVPWARGTDDDREDEHDGREGPDEDEEPSLGWTGFHGGPIFMGGCDDRELDAGERGIADADGLWEQQRLQPPSESQRREVEQAGCDAMKQLRSRGREVGRGSIGNVWAI